MAKRDPAAARRRAEDCARKRRQRQRQRNGITMLRVPINEAAFVAAAVDAGLLLPGDGENADAIAAAASKIIRSWTLGVPCDAIDSQNMLWPAGVVENEDHHVVEPPRRANGHPG